jgi:phosphatidylinositol-3-phosphatase
MHNSSLVKMTGLLVAVVALLVVGAAVSEEMFFDGHGAAAVPTRFPRKTVPSATSRIEVVVMENQNYPNVIGNSEAPYTNRLAARYGLATHMYAVTHPSLPNYLAMTAGRTYGLVDDNIPRPLPGPDLMTQLDSAGSSWQAYFAGVPDPCYTGPHVIGYSRGLNPFVINRRILASRKSCSNLKPMSRLAPELESGTLPDLAWISPSLTEDSHDSSVKAGDTYLSRLVPRLIPSLGPKGALFIIWDEAKTAHSRGKTSAGINGTRGGGHIPAIVVGPGVRPGARTSSPMTQYSILRFIEHSFGLSYLNHAIVASDSPLRSMFVEPPSPHRG